MKIIYSAPHPVIISGFQSMNFGKPGLAFAHEDRTICTVSENTSMKNSQLAKTVVEVVKRYLKKENKLVRDTHVSVNVVPQLKYSSEAIVATTAALLEFFSGKQFSEETINQIAFSVEKKLYPQSLGLTTSCASFGGIIYFRREFMFLTTVSKLPIKIAPEIEKNLYITSSKKKTLSKKNHLNKLFKTNLHLADKILSDIEKETRKLVVALSSENEDLSRASLDSLNRLQEDLLDGEEHIVHESSNNGFIKFKQATRGILRE